MLLGPPSISPEGLVPADFAGNVKSATPEATGDSQRGDMLVAVKLKVSGNGVILTCTPLA